MKYFIIQISLYVNMLLIYAIIVFEIKISKGCTEDYNKNTLLCVFFAD